MSDRGIVFISNGRADHATEELWSRTAALLAKQKLPVSASVQGWAESHWRVQRLRNAEIDLHIRPTRYSLSKRAFHYVFFRNKSKEAVEVERFLRVKNPKLVIFSDGPPFPPIELIELCISMNIPFATIANGNDDRSWPVDELAKRYRNAFAQARRCYFVSMANLRLTEKQIGHQLQGAEVVWSQYNVDFNFRPPWPSSVLEGELRFACVGRLYPPHKGQDLLLEALASSAWAGRPWHLTFYGEGPMRHSIERLVGHLGLSNRVTFAGHVNVETIWSKNHVLALPSRSEGLPLALVEAMLCGRPVLATNVGGNAEIVVDGATGFLVGPPSVENVASGLQRLWDNRANLETMGKAGAKRIRELAPPDPIRVFAEKIARLVQES